MLTTLEQQLEERKSQERFRSLRSAVPVCAGKILLEGKELWNLASNDYLNLSQHRLLKERSEQYCRRYGAGAGASRLLGGNLDVYDSLEKKLARLKGTETALIFPSGFQCNSTVLPALLGKTSFSLVDRLSHHSILSGIISSGSKWKRFHHNNFNDARKYLHHANKEQDLWLITESVFSMDGDLADLVALEQLAAETGASVYIDEAHATGVFGANGCGLAAKRQGMTVIMGTFGKALGSFGAFIACSHKVKDFLINFCGGFIYSTALPPAVLGAVDAALDVIGLPEMETERRLLLDNAEFLRLALNKLGFDTLYSACQIIPVVVGEDKQALHLSKFLEAAGFYIPAVRPPTVPEGSARLRISLSTAIPKMELLRLISLIADWRMDEA